MGYCGNDNDRKCGVRVIGKWNAYKVLRLIRVFKVHNLRVVND